MEHLKDDQFRTTEGVAICVEMLREVRRHLTSRYSIICWRVEFEDRERFGEELRLNKAELDWIFGSCYGLYAPRAVYATHNHTPFIYQNAAKHLWPIDEGFADYAKGRYYVSNVGELEDVMRYSLKTITPDGRVDNFFSIYGPRDARNVLGGDQNQGSVQGSDGSVACRPGCRQVRELEVVPSFV